MSIQETLQKFDEKFEKFSSEYVHGVYSWTLVVKIKSFIREQMVLIVEEAIKALPKPLDHMCDDGGCNEELNWRYRNGYNRALEIAEDKLEELIK